MAQYQSSLTGPEIDAALTDIAQHDSEAWAVGTRDGAAVTSLDVTYHNNAAYYANEASGAAARAEAAVPAGTAGAVFFDQAQVLTDAQKKQARDNIEAGAIINTGATAGSTANYTTFAKIPKNSTGTASYGSYLLANIGGALYADKGLYFLQYLNRNSTLSITVQPIGTIAGYGTFYYKDGGDGYWHIMAYRSASNGAAISVLPLYMPTNYFPEFRDYGSTASIDATWTAIPVRGIYRLGRNANITSLAELKAQMTEWATGLGTGGMGYYNATFASSISPFSGIHPMIQIMMSDAANYGTATITTYKNGAGCNMYLMSFYNGAWTDPTTVTTA